MKKLRKNKIFEQIIIGNQIKAVFKSVKDYVKNKFNVIQNMRIKVSDAIHDGKYDNISLSVLYYTRIVTVENFLKFY